MKIDFGQIIQKFNKLDNKIKYLIFIAVLLIILVLDLFTIMSFQYGLLQNINSENQGLQQNIDLLKLDMQRIDQMKASLLESRKQLDLMNMKVRPVEEKNSILDNISHLATEQKVTIEQLTPQSESPQDLASNGNIKYYALPIVVQSTSSYHAFGRFINKLESGKLFFILSGLTIENIGTDIKRNNINATLKVVLSDKITGGQKK